ncbi:diacylglycerol kinase family protein [Microscilla marina]|nr:diacylglycerol kinase family protein [Microscilla marina]
MIKKRLKSFGYAGKGIKFFFVTQPHAKVHTVMAFMAIVLGIGFDIARTDWLAIVVAIGLVLVAETTNTALEELVNFVSPDYHKQAGIVKDIAAGAVLLAAITALVIGVLVFLPQIVKLIQT